MDIELSIIIPVYNCKSTIERCLDSIFLQETTLKYEVILVNDGSLDGSEIVINNLIKNRENVRLINQKNFGAGAARNNALKYATGKYLLFIDSDDYISYNSFDILKNEIEQETQPDIVIFMYRYFDEFKSCFKKMSIRDSEIYYNNDFNNKIFQFREYEKLHLSIAYPWNKIYKNEFVKENKINFSETFVHNDIFFNHYSIARSKKIKIIKDILYTHVINSKEIQLTRVFDERRLDVINVFDECDCLLKKINSFSISYIIFKLLTLNWIISKSDGKIKTKFKCYLKIFLDSLDKNDIKKIISYHMLPKSLYNILREDGYISNKSFYFNKLRYSLKYLFS